MKAKSSNQYIDQVADWIEKWLEPPVQFIILLRVQTAVIIAVFLILQQVGQTREIYRAIALDNNLYQAGASIALVSTLTIFVWYTARFLVLETTQQSEEHSRSQSQEAVENRCKVWLDEWGPRILGIIPMLGLSLGIWEAWGRSVSNAEGNFFLLIWAIITVVFGSIIFLLFVKRTDWFGQFLGSKEQGKKLFSPDVEIGLANVAYIAFSAFSLPLIAAASGSTLSLGVVTIFILSLLFNIILYSWHSERGLSSGKKIICWCIASLLLSTLCLLTLPPTALPSKVGAIGVVAIGFTILVVAFSAIYDWALEKRIPALTFLVGLAVFSSLLNLNDNHQFRWSPKPPDQPLPGLEESFKVWLANRPDRTQYAEEPYPVYLVSAQGGGIYAAYHAATALTQLSEAIPNFPQHVFAISGVSGGSLGSSAFASLIKERRNLDQPLSEAISKIFDQDLLSPLLALGLFPDLIQRFIPFSINDWDRASGLEVAFEKAWNRLPGQEKHDNPFQGSFYQHWQPEGIAPALVLNTTVVENGKRLVISPFRIVLPTQENIVLDESSLDLRLSTAAGLSARFPFVTPVGWYKRSDGSRSRLADGGYFDNSGIPTTIDMGRVLQKLEGYGKTFKLVYLAIVDQPSDSALQPQKPSGLNEILSPIRTLFEARTARSLSAIELSTYTLNKGITNPFELKFRTLVLQKVDPQKQIDLPLGWQLSTISKEFITAQTPAPDQCDVDGFKAAFVHNTSSLDAKNHNSCVARSIEAELS